jgi:hypothetical protein
MKYYILGKKGYTWKSALTLAQEFRANGIPFYASTKSRNRRTPIFINWGNSDCEDAWINPKLTTDKFTQLKVLQDAHIPTIQLYKSVDEIPEERFPVLCRQKHHQAGNDIVFSRAVEEIVPAYFYTPFEKFDRELRIHAFKITDLGTRAFKKVCEGEEKQHPIRNLENGYLFRKVAISEALSNFLVQILDALEMDFMCADIGIQYEKGRKIYKVIEVNSAPSLVNNGNTLYWYMNNFGRSLFSDWQELEYKG